MKWNVTLEDGTGDFGLVIAVEAETSEKAMILAENTVGNDPDSFDWERFNPEIDYAHIKAVEVDPA